MKTTTKSFSLTTQDPERILEFEFVRGTESAALNVLQRLGRGENGWTIVRMTQLLSD